MSEEHTQGPYIAQKGGKERHGLLRKTGRAKHGTGRNVGYGPFLGCCPCVLWRLLVWAV